LSVTRVGRQTQTPLLRSLSRNLISFLAEVERKQSLVHFGAEITSEIEQTLARGELVEAFLQQKSRVIVPINVQIYFLSLIWLGKFGELKSEEVEKKLKEIIEKYEEDKEFQMKVDKIIEASESWEALLKNVDAKAN